MYRELFPCYLRQITDLLAQGIHIIRYQGFKPGVGVEIAVRTAMHTERYVQIQAEGLHTPEYTTRTMQVKLTIVFLV